MIIETAEKGIREVPVSERRGVAHGIEPPCGDEPVSQWKKRLGRIHIQMQHAGREVWWATRRDEHKTRLLLFSMAYFDSIAEQF